MDFLGIAGYLWDLLIMTLLPVLSAVMVGWGLWGVKDRLRETINRTFLRRRRFS